MTEETRFDLTNRPQSLKEMIGQQDVREQLKLAIFSANSFEEPMDHVVMYGPPGVGKTTLAQVIANELDTDIKKTTGPLLRNPGDITSLLSSLEPRDVLFIDEIHRTSPSVEEYLYTAMEDFRVDGLGDVAPFTLVGATTNLGQLTSPLRSRFGLTLNLDSYNVEDIAEIILRDAKMWDITISGAAAHSLASCARGSIRIAKNLLRRVRDYQRCFEYARIDSPVVSKAITALGIDSQGLNSVDRKLLMTLAERFNGGPKSLWGIATIIEEDAGTLETVHEPYLLKAGFLEQTPRGRVLTDKAWDHLGLSRKD